jgi:hypothetical protein
MSGISRAPAEPVLALPHRAGLLPVKSVICLFLALAPAAWAQQPSPREILDQYAIAHRTLNFSEVVPYIHTRTLSVYRETTSVIIKHAIEKFGNEALVQFFQGTTLDDLKSFSDQQYWAFVMASSLQFSNENQVPQLKPVGEIMEGRRLLLDCPVPHSFVTAPELGTFRRDLVFAFEQENGSWKMVSFATGKFEATLYWFLQKNNGEGRSQTPRNG